MRTSELLKTCPLAIPKTSLGKYLFIFGGSLVRLHAQSTHKNSRFHKEVSVSHQAC